VEPRGPEPGRRVGRSRGRSGLGLRVGIGVGELRVGERLERRRVAERRRRRVRERFRLGKRMGERMGLGLGQRLGQLRVGQRVGGAMLLPPQLLVLIPLISHLPDWIRKRYAWYIQTFNILNFTLAVMCAWGAARLVDHTLAGRSAGWAAGAAAAAVTYVVLNNVGFAVILHLARGHDPRAILNPQ